MVTKGTAWVAGPSASVWLRVPRDALGKDGFSPASTYLADHAYAFLSAGDADRFIAENDIDEGLVPDAYFRLKPHRLKEVPPD